MDHGVVDVVRDVRDAPSPAPDLRVLLDQAARIRAGTDCVAVDWDEERDGPELTAVAEEALPEEAAVFGDRIGGPVVDLVDRLKGDGIRTEADQALGREVAPHLDMRRPDGHEPHRQWALPQVV